MNDNNKQVVLAELIQKELDGTLTDQEFSILQKSLNDDPEAVNYYVKTMLSISAFSANSIALSFDSAAESEAGEDVFDMNAWMVMAEYEKTAPGIEVIKEHPQQELIQKVVYPPREKVRMPKFQKFALAACAAIVLFFVYLNYAPQKSYNVEVATVTDSINATWADNVPMQKGARLMNDGQAYMLREGLVKVEFDSHVTAVIEAPTEFEILAEDRIGLRYGKVYSIVSSEGSGFSVYTPSAKIVDLGTEFGVQAELDGDTQLQVFKGETMLLFDNGQNDGKSNMKIGEGVAKRVSSDTGEVTDVSFNNTRFIQRIDSKNTFIWKGQKWIDLADIVNGGNGFGTGRKGFCIMPDTGSFIATDDSPLGPDPSGVTEYQKSYMRAVPELAAVDCVIVPGYEARGALPLSTTGLSVPDFPEITGSVRWRIQTQPYYRSSVTLNGREYCIDQNPAILMYASTGITFDLDKIRQTVPGLDIVSFKAMCGINEKAIQAGGGKYDPAETADVHIFLDGRRVLYQSVKHVENNAIPVEIDLTDELAPPRFMTLLVTCGTQGNSRDQFVFGAPELILEER